MKFNIEITLGGERLYVKPYVPTYQKTYPKIPVESEDGYPNLTTDILRNRILVEYPDNYSLPCQLRVNHKWVNCDYLPPTKEFIYYVLIENSKGNLLDRYLGDDDVDLFNDKVREAALMLYWITENGGIDNIEFIYSLDT